MGGIYYNYFIQLKEHSIENTMKNTSPGFQGFSPRFVSGHKFRYRINEVLVYWHYVDVMKNFRIKQK